MSAINVVVQSNAVHIMTDGLSYENGLPLETDLIKTEVLSGMRAAIAATGPAGFIYFLSEKLVEEFSAFDDLVCRCRDRLPDLFADYVARYRDLHEGEIASLVIAGWHEKTNKPAAYAIDLHAGGDEKRDFVKRNNPHVSEDSNAVELTKLDIIAVPCPTIEELRATGFNITRERDSWDPENDLLRLMNLQRLKKYDDGRHYVGGLVTLTTITEAGVEQRPVHVWNEDKIGKPIVPQSVDWTAWRLERDGVKLTDLSRLQRERMLKKAREGKRLAV